jgi:hypothetical protein
VAAVALAAAVIAIGYLLHSRDGAGVGAALNKAVCSRTVTLAAAQTSIAADWTTALATFGLPALR